MKKLTVITTLIILTFFCKIELKAQNDDLYSYMEQYLTSEEKDQISRAKSSFDKAQKYDAQIKEEDSQTDKYFSKKSKKGEKKSVDAKELRIKQAMVNEQAYVLLYNVYAEKIGEGVFVFEEDEAKVNSMLEEASADNASASKKIKSYKSSSPKDLKKNVIYSKLKSDIQGMISLYESSIKKLIEAYTVIVDQEHKKQLADEENRSWQNAQSENTIYSYKNYINDYPNGKHVSEANSLISDLEAIERKKQEDASKSISNIVFQVQIAASKNKLPDWKIKSIYKQIKDVEPKFLEGWYKYFVGNFKTYDDAKKVANKIKKGAFVVPFRDGKKIDIKEAIGKN
jgi:hypothetical protein